MRLNVNKNAVVMLQWLLPYLDADCQLFPIKKPSMLHIGASKSPRDVGYKQHQYSRDDILVAIDEGYNIGYILPENILIIDVDPRNFPKGENSLNNLNKFLNMDLINAYPTVRTGGGGYHIYMHIPLGLKIHKNLSGYAGIDFINFGRYVLCAGCKHPSGKHYYWYKEQIKFDDLRSSPLKLVQQIKKLTGVHAIESNQKASKTVPVLIDCPDLILISNLLNLIPVEEYRPQEAWFSILCAVHHSTQGSEEGLNLFLNWSLCDPMYADNGDKITIRWYSLGNENEQVTTINTLIYEAKRHQPDETNQLIGYVMFKKLSPLNQVTIAPYGSDSHFNNSFFVKQHFNNNILLNDENIGYYFCEDSHHWKELTWQYIETLYQKKLESVNVKQQTIDTGLRGLKRRIRVLTLANPAKLLHVDDFIESQPFKTSTVITQTGIFFPERYASRSNYFEPFSANIYASVQGTYDFDSKAKCPYWLNFLDSIWEKDDELKKQLQVFFGYCLLDDNRFHKIGLFVGVSRGGKSLITHLLSELLNQHFIATLSLARLDSNFALSSIVGKKLITIPEAQGMKASQSNIVIDLLKSISGGDFINVGRRYLSDLRVEAVQKILLVANEMPHFIDSADALLNRLLVFPFIKTFKGKENVHLKSKLMKELPGILNWSLEGLQYCLKNNRVHESQSSLIEKELIGERLQPLTLFVDDCCEFGEEFHVSKNDLYDKYHNWCLQEGFKYPKNKTNFFHAIHGLYPMLDLRASVRNMNGRPARGVRGIKIKLRAVD